MALPSKYGIEKSLNSMAGLSAYENGGPGSGNFGHAGRPGQRGGSGKGTGASKYDVPASIMDAYATSSSKYNDPEKMEIFTTPKGNLNLRYDGKDVSTISGSEYSDETLESLREQGILQDANRSYEKTGEAEKIQKEKRLVDEIKEEYASRKDEMDAHSDRIEEKIYETGESYVGSKKSVMDMIKKGILTQRKEYSDDGEFHEMTAGLFDDLDFVSKSKTSKIKVSEHPMSESGLIFEEVKDKK